MFNGLLKELKGLSFSLVEPASGPGYIRRLPHRFDIPGRPGRYESMFPTGGRTGISLFGLDRLVDLIVKASRLNRQQASSFW